MELLYKNPSLFDRVGTDATKRLLSGFGILLLILVILQMIPYFFIHFRLTYHRAKREIEDDETKVKFLGRIIFLYFVNWETFRFISLFVMGIIGCTLSPLYFAYYLFIATLKSKKLMTTIYALLLPIINILLLLMLYLLFEYFFAVLAYIIFPGDFNERTCNTLINCFLYIVDQTHKEDGGIGAAIDPSYDEAGSKIDINYGRVVYDFFFAFIVLQIIIQLISGLIIDVFKELRGEVEKKEEDLKSSCIICGNSKEDIQRIQNYDYHIAKVHNIWHYVMFIVYLQKKPAIDYNGTESYVHDNIEEICWLPYSL